MANDLKFQHHHLILCILASLTMSAAASLSFCSSSSSSLFDLNHMLLLVSLMLGHLSKNFDYFCINESGFITTKKRKLAPVALQVPGQ